MDPDVQFVRKALVRYMKSLQHPMSQALRALQGASTTYTFSGRDTQRGPSQPLSGDGPGQGQDIDPPPAYSATASGNSDTTMGDLNSESSPVRTIHAMDGHTAVGEEPAGSLGSHPGHTTEGLPSNLQRPGAHNWDSQTGRP